jgi:GTPase SAR1 family protein
MKNNTYNWLKSQYKHLVNLLERQIVVNDQIEFDPKSTRKLHELVNRLNNEDFKVLVMGLFSSGKSTFINALLGQRILPAKMMPATAIICEIKYAEEPKCTLYPKQGKYIDKQTGRPQDEPFEIRVEELKDYILINHDLSENSGPEEDADEDPRLESCFERLVLHWPLGICKEGVEIIDSPGLNDPDSHDRITLEYLPKTDAIIYCMNSGNALYEKDRETIEELRHMGYKSIIFILTNFDRIQESGEEEEFVRSMTSKLSKYTSLGAEGILFVNSLGGVIAKEKHDTERLHKSNILAVEARVENHLVSQKGKAKLFIAAAQVGNQNDIVGKSIDHKINLNSLDQEELKRVHEKLESILDGARVKRDLLMAKLKLGIVDVLAKTRNMGQLFLNSLDGDIGDWAEKFTPQTSLKNPFKIRTRTKAMVQEYMDHIKHKIKIESSLWSSEALYPMIKESVRNIAVATEDLQKSYQGLIDEYEVVINLGDIDKKVTEEVEPSQLSRFGALLYGLTTGDVVSATLGMAFGVKGLLSSLGAQVGAIVILYVVSLFTPVGWIAFVFGAIAAALGTGIWNLASIPREVEKGAIKKTREALRDRKFQDDVLAKINESLTKELDQLVEAAEEAFAADITPKEAELKKSKEFRAKDKKAMEEAEISLKAAKKANDDNTKNIESFNSTISL